MSVSDMARRFFTTRNVITELFSYLKQHNYVRVDRKFTIRGKGRFIYCFKKELNVPLEQDLFLSNTLKRNDPIVKKIIRNELQEIMPPPGIHVSPLRSSNRLFILILVIHADQMGRVSALSSSNIRQMMGSISSDRFKSQMRKLQSLKLLSCYIAGLTSKILFGKITSTYFINLNHPLFIDWLPYTSNIYIEAECLLLEPANHSSEANALISASKSKDKSFTSDSLTPIRNVVKLQDFYHFFSDVNVHDHLQLSFFDVASAIILEIWGNAANVYKENEVDKKSDLCKWSKVLPTPLYKLLEKLGICDDLLFIEVLGNSFKNIKLKSDMTNKEVTLITVLILLSLNIAKKYQEILVKIIGTEIDVTEYCIIPKQKIYTQNIEYEIRFISTDTKKKRLNLSFVGNELQNENGRCYCLKKEFIKCIQQKYLFNHYFLSIANDNNCRVKL